MTIFSIRYPTHPYMRINHPMVDITQAELTIAAGSAMHSPPIRLILSSPTPLGFITQTRPSISLVLLASSYLQLTKNTFRIASRLKHMYIIKVTFSQKSI